MSTKTPLPVPPLPPAAMRIALAAQARKLIAIGERVFPGRVSATLRALKAILDELERRDRE